MKIRFFPLGALLALSGLVGCTARPVSVPAPAHVIIVGFDGLGSRCIRDGAPMPTLRRLMAEGASTLQNRSVLPSSSAVNWASLFMGAGPELHGYTEWGSRVPDLPSRVLNRYGTFPSVFGELRTAHPEAEIGYLYEWEGMAYVADTLAMSYRRHCTAGMTDSAVAYIRAERPAFCAVVYDQPDGAGHAHGWGSEVYLANVARLDSALARIVEAIEEAGMAGETVLMVVADHGGVGTGHGGKTPDEMETPLVFWGKGVKRGHTIVESTMIYDGAATIAALFGLKPPQVWVGRPVTSAFE